MGERDERIGPDGMGVPSVDPWATFDRWTSNLFLIMAVIGLLVILTIAGLDADRLQGVALLMTLAIAALAAAILVVTSVGLDRRLGWARPTAWALLVIVIATGLAGAAIDLTRNTVTFPLGAIVALFVAPSKPGALPAVQGRDRRVAIGLAILFLAATLGGGVPAWLLTSPDSPLVGRP